MRYDDTMCSVFDDKHSNVNPVLSVYIPSEMGFRVFKERMQSALDRDYYARMNVLVLPNMPKFSVAPVRVTDADVIDVSAVRNHFKRHAVDIESLE